MMNSPTTTGAKKRLKGIIAGVAVAAAATLALAGCASGGGDKPADSGINIAVIGGMASDGFWTIVKNGTASAGKAVEAAGGKVTWLPLKSYDNLGPDAGDLVRSAIGLKVSAIVVADWVPEAEDPAIKDAVTAGIPVWIYNSGGIAAADAVGAEMYIGTDDYLGGVAGGEYFTKNGSKNIICVNTTPGAVNQENRCQGVADGAAKNGGKSKQLPLPASNFGDQTAIAQAIKGALVADSSIDGVITIGAQDSDAAASGIDQAGMTGKAQLGTFDLSENVLKRIAGKTQLFAIDQQPFLQGYMAVSMAWQKVQYGIAPASRTFLTGPSLVTEANVAAVQSGVTAGTR